MVGRTSLIFMVYVSYFFVMSLIFVLHLLFFVCFVCIICIICIVCIVCVVCVVYVPKVLYMIVAYVSLWFCILVVFFVGVVKKTRSGRALQFITDDGVVYQLSFKLFMMVVNDEISGDFVVLSRMPFGVPPGRFPKSVVYGDSGVVSAVDSVGSDAFSKDFLQERSEQKSGRRVSDFKVDW